MRMDAVIRATAEQSEHGEHPESPKFSPAEIRKRYLEAVVTSPASTLVPQLLPPPPLLQLERRKPQIVSVPPPPDLALPPSPHPETIMEYLTRRKEAERRCYRLTEGDVKLIMMNSKDATYTSGTVMFGESTPVNGLYRIKSGKVLLMKQGQKLFEMDRGFIGEMLLVNGGETCCQGYTLVASGPVVISEISISFIQQLMEADNLLAFKIYRQIASKLAAVLYSVITLSLDVLAQQALLPPISAVPPSNSPARPTRSDSFSSSDSGGSGDHQTEGSSGSGSGIETSTMRHTVSRESSQELSGSGGAGRLRKRFSSSGGNKKGKDVPYKVYHLENSTLGSVTVELTDIMIIVVSPAIGFKLKRKIKYDKILDVAKTGKTSVTIIYDMQAKTLFFKMEGDRDEFYTIVQSLLGVAPPPTPQLPEPSAANCPLMAAKPGEYHGEIVVPKGPIHPSCDKYILRGIAVKQTLKKGDIIVAPGDLYQRVYTIAEGQVDIKHEGRACLHLLEGEVFGMLTLFHLRPSVLTFEVVSETCTLLIIPAHKFVALAHTNLSLSVRMHKRACKVLVDQIGNTVKSQKEVVTGFSEPHVFM